MSKPLEIVLADLYYMNRLTAPRLCVPLNVGYVAAYTEKVFGEAVTVSIFKDVNRLLDHVRRTPPDVVGFSFYYWNQNLNYYAARAIKKLYGRQTVVVFGGPSVDSMPQEQEKLLKRFPLVDVFVEGEGEAGFADLVGRVMQDREGAFESPLVSAFFGRDGELVGGVGGTNNLPLSEVPSPYLTGRLEGFVRASYFPLLQATRTCPYLCTFCVSGKDRSKLRAFSLEQVKGEIDYIAFWNKDRPHVLLNLAELNFGINKQDPELAAYLRSVSERTGYPKSVYFYSDKRFTETSKRVVEALGDINKDGLVFSLQSDHPETLLAINRKNLPDDTIREGVEWAKARNIPVTTELIFGLPHESYESAVQLLEKSVQQGFDSIMLHNLFLMEGIELNRDSQRALHQMKTKYRLLGSNYTILDGELVFEYELVVTENKYFNFEEFVKVRCLNVMLFAVFQGSFYKYFFQYVKSRGVSLISFFERFMDPDRSEPWPAEYLEFVDDFREACVSELYDDLETLGAEVDRVYRLRNDVGEPGRLNPYFYSRLMYTERGWLNSVLRSLLLSMAEEKALDFAEVDEVLDVSGRLIIDLKELRTSAGTIETRIDYSAWKADKFHGSLDEFKGESRIMCLEMTNQQTNKLRSFASANAHLTERDFYFVAVETVFPRADLFYRFLPEARGQESEDAKDSRVNARGHDRWSDGIPASINAPTLVNPSR
jgi:radical SAM superfamily enzyme YgiQ (UPF0313 family)